MQKLVLASILTISGFYINAQDSLTRKSVMVYGFKDFSVIMVSRSTTDSLLMQAGNRVQPPSKERVVSVLGPIFKIFLTTNKEPFPYPVNHVALDAETKYNKKIALEDLEIRRGLIRMGLYSEWMDVKSFPLLAMDSSIFLDPSTPGNLPVTKGDYYILFQFSVAPYSRRVLSIRNKNTKEEIANFRFTVLDDPVLPFLMHAKQDDSDIKLIDSFNMVRSRLWSMPDVEFVPQKGSAPLIKVREKATDTAMMLRNENLYETSGLVLWFKKHHHMYPDSSLEYRLLSESNKDTNWLKTGHRLVISQLVPGNHYKLQIRYELHRAHIQEHTFYVVPKWYQATQTKIIFIGLVILIALLTWLLVYKRLLNKSKRRREQLSLEIKSIRSQLNPHFIFNALSSIQGLINKNEIPAANHYLTEFSTLLRESLHHNDKDMVPLVTEVNLLKTYLRLEQLRFNFKYEMDIDQAIDKNATEIPNLMLQPLVENAVKHGVSTLGEKGLIKIAFIKRVHDLHVLITDNGNKFDETRHTDGFGLKLTKNRISLLSQTLKEQPIKLTIGRKQDMETIVHLVFTNWI